MTVTPPKPPFTGIRLDGATRARVEAMRVKLSRPWRKATTSDALRMLILSSLKRAEEHGIAGLSSRHGSGREDAQRPSTSTHLLAPK